MNKRFLLFCYLLFLIPFGFICKLYDGPFEDWINNSLVNILYVIFWAVILVVALPNYFSPLKAAVTAFIFSVLIEFSQLLSSPALKVLRQNLLGRTILGTSFSLGDIIYNLIGAAIGWGIMSRQNRDKYHSS